MLWEHWLSDGQKKYIGESISNNSKDSAKQLVKFISLVHDIGKATPAFQIKEGFSNSRDLDMELMEKLEFLGFRGISKLILSSQKNSKHNIAGQYILSQFGVKEDISTIIGGHHGKTIDNINEYKNQSSFKANYYQVEGNNEISNLWKSYHEKIFRHALSVSGYKDVDDLPRVEQPCQVLLLGLLIVADWIASNDEFFPLIDINETEVFDKKERKKSGFDKWKKSDLWQPENNNNILEIYNKRFGFNPRNVQKKLSEVISKCNEPGIFILEAPMGIGKTEAALVAAEQLAAKTKRSGLFFGLPTQATSNGIFPRILSWLNSIKRDYDDTFQIRLAHGKAYLNDNFMSLASCIDADDEGSLIVNQWFSGKKTTALDDFVVGTVDQFLMLSLKQKHLFLRHLGFSKKVVIIDEVHAYDTYMSQYLNESITWMAAYGVPVILLSATLPALSREKIIFSYIKGRKTKLQKYLREELKNILKTRSYPLITYTDGNEVKIEDKFDYIENKMVNIDYMDEDNLIPNIKEMISDNGVVGIIVNTVKRGQKFAKILSDYFGEEMVVLLHSGFIATERVKKEDELLSIIGKNVKRPKQKIIIGTQVIEQSLDIDFDILISDLAPVDLLIQRIGRLHRHEIDDRPYKHIKPKLYILGQNQVYEFEEGSKHVYGGYLLMRTQYFLDKYKEIAIPGDISELVQDVYSDSDIDISESLKKIYMEYKEFDEEINSLRERKAKTYRIDNPVVIDRSNRILKKDNLIGWINNSIKEDSDEKCYAQVRDGIETIEIIVVKKVGNGYGLFDSEVDISMRVDEDDIAKNIARNTIILPRFFSAPYIIDKTIDELEKYNYKYLEKWQKTTWLRGCLGIVLDEDNEFELLGKTIKYEEKYGISIVEKGSE